MLVYGNCCNGNLHPKVNFNIKQINAIIWNGYQRRSDGESYCRQCMNIRLGELQIKASERQQEADERAHSAHSDRLRCTIQNIRAAGYPIKAIQSLVTSMRDFGHYIENQVITHPSGKEFAI